MPIVREVALLMVLSATAKLALSMGGDERVVGAVGVGYFFVYLPWRFISARREETQHQHHPTTHE